MLPRMLPEGASPPAVLALGVGVATEFAESAHKQAAIRGRDLRWTGCC